MSRSTFVVAVCFITIKITSLAAVPRVYDNEKAGSYIFSDTYNERKESHWVARCGPTIAWPAAAYSLIDVQRNEIGMYSQYCPW